MLKRTATKILILLCITVPSKENACAQGAGGAAPQKTASARQQGQGGSALREAVAAFDKGDWDDAARQYEKLAKAAPDVADYHLNLGIAYYSSGRPHDAIQPLRQALKLKPTLALARYYLGPSLGGSGQCQEALSYLKKDIARVSEKRLKYEIGLAGVRCSMALNQPNDAIDFVRMLNREFPHDPEVLYQTVHIYSDLSTRTSQELLFRAPTSYQVHMLNAEALEVQAKWEDAVKEYRAVLEKNPRLPGIHYRLGRLILSAPKTETTVVDATKEFEEELKIDPYNAGAEYVLGELAFQAADLEKAIQHLSRAAKLDAGFADAHLELGRALIAAERVREAVAPLETAVRLQPENPLTHFHLSAAYSRLGRSQEAQRERSLHQGLSEKMRQTREDVQKAVSNVPTTEPAK